MPRVLIAGLAQEVSSFNPSFTEFDLFTVHRGGGERLRGRCRWHLRTGPEELPLDDRQGAALSALDLRRVG